MAVTIGNLFNKIKNNNVVLAAGENGLKNIAGNIRIIEESVASSFLEKKDIGIVVGMGINNENELLEIVNKAYFQKAAGIIFCGDSLKNSDLSEVFEFCDRHKIPLFKTENHSYMTNVIKEISEVIGEDERKALFYKNAVKNSINFPEQEKLYVDEDGIKGLKSNSIYNLSLIEIFRGGEKIKEREEIRLYLTETEDYIAAYYKNVICFEFEKCIAVFIEGYKEDEIREILSGINKHLLLFREPSFKIHVASGGNVNAANLVSKSYKNALKELKLIRSKALEDKISFYEDMGTYKLLMAIEDNEVLKNYYAQFLSEVEIYDRINHSDFMYVLKTFFENECSVQNTAEILYMHRNSVRYKLNKIEEMLGIDLSCVEDRTRVYIALMIKDMIG